jgi:hypothetical protein
MLLKVKGLIYNPLVDDLNLFPHEWWDLIGIDTLFVTSWRKCVLCHHANKIGFHINLSIEKCEIESR